MKKLLLPFIILFTVLILSFTIRGLAGNPDQNTINQTQWTDNGPFELSPDRSRFALMYSVVEDHSFYFSLPIARFALPDLGYKNGHYVSLFAPFLSFVIIPGYLIGKMFNMAQVGAFAVISIFALLNMLLIRSIAIRLGANRIAAAIAGLVFLFATPAFAYAVSLYQHHVSTFLLLASIYLLLRWNTIWSLLAVFFFFAIGVPLDNPNFFFMAPVAIMAGLRMISIQKERVKYIFRIDLLRLITPLIMIIPIGLFFWINYLSYGNPLQLAGTVRNVTAIDVKGQPTSSKKITTQNIDKALNKDKNNEQRDAVAFFETRNLLNGMYIHSLSPDRGIIYFTPVILLGIVGIFLLYKKDSKYTTLFLSIIGANVLLYSMWGDPWGGWAFGSRYLIPTYAILAIFLAFALSKKMSNFIFYLLFLGTLVYSVHVNTIGALSSNRNPPQVQVLALEKLSGRQEKYTYERGLDMLQSNISKSYVWQTYFSDKFTAIQYYWFVLLLIVAPLVALSMYLVVKEEDANV